MIRVELAVYLSEAAHAAYRKVIAAPAGVVVPLAKEHKRLMVERDRIVSALCPFEYGVFGAWALSHMIIEDESRLGRRCPAGAS